MSTEAFLRCFWRYVSQRGIPKLVVSDNVKSFKSAAGTLVALFELPKVKTYFIENKIHWRFNLEKAPWWSGFFERLVKSTKRCLKKILANARLNYEELLTLLCEVEAVLNSRPIIYVYCEDVETLLTPSHLVLGKHLILHSKKNFKMVMSEEKLLDWVKEERRVQHCRDQYSNYFHWKSRVCQGN